MWFKNLRVYRLTRPWTLSADALAERLSAFPFKPCQGHELVRYGWVPPLKGTSHLAHGCQGRILICAKKQEKILPGAVVNEQLEERIAEINQREGRRLSRRERQDLKDEIQFSLIPKAFSRSRLDFAYVDSQAGLILVNAASAKRAEDLLAALRQAIESLPCLPIKSQQPITSVLTQWLRQGYADHPWVFGEEVELLGPKDGRILRAKKQDLSADEIRNHTEVGMVVQKMALSWPDKLEFILDDQLAIKRLKFSDVLAEQAQGQSGDSEADAMDADLSIMGPMLAEFIDQLLKTLGGEVDQADQD